MSFIPEILIVGSSDRCTACALRLYRAGFLPLLVSGPAYDLHHSRTFSAALSAGEVTRESLTAMTIARALEKNICQPGDGVHAAIKKIQHNRQLPLLTEQDIKNFDGPGFDYIVVVGEDSLVKIPSRLTDNSRWIGTSVDRRGLHYFVAAEGEQTGRVQYPFLEESPAVVHTKQTSPAEIVKAPLEGVFVATVSIDELVREKQELGRINEIPILSPIAGKVTGLLSSGQLIPAHTPFAEINHLHNHPSGRQLPAEAFSIAGGVLEAILYDIHLEHTNG